PVTHAMIFSHISYCYTSWSQASTTTLKSIETLYKQTLKTLDQKPISYHHCHITTKYNLFKFDSFLQFLDACLIFEILHWLAPPPLNEFIKLKDGNGWATRAVTMGDCVIQYRHSTFVRTVFSVRAPNYWNTLPTNVRECASFSVFKNKLKNWMKNNQTCNHN